MNSGILPFLLLSATLGLVLSFVPLRTAALGAVIVVITAFAVFLVAPLGHASPKLTQLIFMGVWASMIVISTIAYLPLAASKRWVIPAAVNAGFWIGVCAALTATSAGVALALAPLVLFVPGRWFTSRDYSIVIKVVASWMIAIAALSTFVSLIPTPGYEPDHME